MVASLFEVQSEQRTGMPRNTVAAAACGGHMVHPH
jgi:hypothetical protein